MAYASDIDLGGIGQAPKTTDPETFADFTDVYNAIHILAQWVDMVYKNTVLKEGKPWETFPLENVFETVAYHSISEGMICSPSYVYRTSDGRAFHGAIRGVAYPVSGRSSDSRNDVWLADRQAPNINGVFGIALDNASRGQTFRMAVGPGILQVPGLRQGEIVASYKAYTEKRSYVSRSLELNNNGSLFRLSSEPQNYSQWNKLTAVGVGVANDAMLLFGPQFVNAQFGMVRSTLIQHDL